MNYKKVIIDYLEKIAFGKMVPIGVVELKKYSYAHGAINFRAERQEDDTYVAYSTNYINGSIITSGNDQEDLDKNIKDAILTAFGIPSAYAKEAGVYKIGSEQNSYAAA